jgi:seryl-tRNA synthetase
MLDINLLRKDIAAVAERLRTRPFELDTATFNALEAERKAIQTRTEELQAQRNTLSRQIGQLKAKGDKDFAELQEMDRLERMLEPDVDETYVQRLERAWRGTLTTSGDPVWDQWLANVRDGVVPSDWWGPLKDGVKG